MTPRRESTSNAQKIPSNPPNQEDSKTKGNLTKLPIKRKLEPIDQEKIQLPQGDLIADLSQKLSFKDEAFIDLRIKEIKHFETIKDFKIPTRSPYPIVIIFKDIRNYHCMDGWNLVQKAKEKNEDIIKCKAFYMDSFSIPLMGIFKLAIRSMPLGGISNHAEMIFNIRICFQLIRERNEIPKANSHGGNRKSLEFSNKMEQKIIELLVEHLGKTKRKILEYINHGDELPDETLEFLVEKGAGRRFFEAVQKNKTNVITRLKQEGKKQKAILKKISISMKKWFDEYEKTGKIASEVKKIKLSPEETKPISSQIASPKKKESQTHIHWQGNTSGQKDLPPTTDHIYAELGTIIELFVQLQEDKPDVTKDLIRRVLNASNQLILLSESMGHLIHHGQTNSEREVA